MPKLSAKFTVMSTEATQRKELVAGKSVPVTRATVKLLPVFTKLGAGDDFFKLMGDGHYLLDLRSADTIGEFKIGATYSLEFVETSDSVEAPERGKDEAAPRVEPFPIPGAVVDTATLVREEFKPV